jgi:hypothetical protein
MPYVDSQPKITTDELPGGGPDATYDVQSHGPPEYRTEDVYWRQNIGVRSHMRGLFIFSDQTRQEQTSTLLAQ